MSASFAVLRTVLVAIGPFVRLAHRAPSLHVAAERRQLAGVGMRVTVVLG